MYSVQLIIACCAVAVLGAPTDDGKWHPEQYGGTGKNQLIESSGKYLRPPNEGKYIHVPNPYIHDDNPYDGGYGPYSHQNEPYVAEASVDRYRYVLTPNEDLPYYKDGYYRNNGIKILEQEFNKREDNYDYKFKTENKIRAAEKAVVKNPNSIDEGIASAGFYEYIGPDGFMYRVDYTADENGFRPKMKRLETPYSGKWTLEKV